MANDNELQGVRSSTTASFLTDTMRSSQCNIATTLARAQGLELLFGVPESLDAAISRQVPRLTHRLLLDRAAATHLEEALARVLGLPADGGRRQGSER
ncbi:MAG: hypothetical protein H7242_08495 [Microbacteriaceae bacterium]|nr:hypothetical protein [Burkholderiaceae bacterium]